MGSHIGVVSLKTSNRYGGYIAGLKFDFRSFALLAVLLLAAFTFPENGRSQTPGQIFLPATGEGRLVLDPNGDGFVSADNEGFSPDVDYGSASEIGFHPLPVLFQEVDGDQRTGGSHTDLYGVRNGLDGHEDPGGFLYSDGNNLIFRMRLVGQSTASKGYSFVFDTTLDGVPDYEVIMRTGGGSAGIQIINADGSAYATTPSPISLNTNFHRALAGIHEDEQRYFYDYFVPWDLMPFGESQNFRVATVTITAASGSYMTGATIGDIGGVDDEAFGSGQTAVNTILGVMPVASGDNLGDDPGDGFGNLVTAVPSINAPVFDTQTSVSGTSIEAEGTQITLQVYADAEATSTTSIHTTSVASSNTWQITGLSLTEGQQLTAFATATGKDPSAESARVNVFSASSGEGGGLVCTPAPLDGNQSGNTFTGTVPGLEVPTNNAQVIIRFYTVNEDGSVGPLFMSTSSDDIVARTRGSTLVYNSWLQSSNGDFAFTLNNGGQGNPYNDSYYVTAQRAGLCESDFAFDGAAVRTEAPVISTSLISASTSQSISGTSTETDGTAISVFRNDDDTVIGTTTVTGGNWSVTISEVVDGDQVYARATNTTGIASARSNIVIVGVSQTDPPTITGSYTNGFSGSITGFTEEGGSQVRVFRNGTQIGEAFSNAFGVWSLDLSELSPSGTLSTDDVLTANALAGGKTRSELSNEVTVLAGETGSPVIYGGDTQRVLSAMGSEIPVSGSGTIRIYIDGNLIVEQSSGSSVLFTAVAEDGGTLEDYIEAGVEIFATRQLTGNTESAPSNVLTVLPDPVRYITTSGASPEPVPSGGGQEVVITFQVLDSDFAPDANVAMTVARVTGAGQITAINGAALTGGRILQMVMDASQSPILLMLQTMTERSR